MIAVRQEAATEGFARSHPRAADIFAELYVGAELFYEFTYHPKPVDDLYLGLSLKGFREALIPLFQAQDDFQRESDEVLFFRRLLKSAFAAGNCHINNRNTQGPPEEHQHRWGWHKEIINQELNHAGNDNQNTTVPKETWKYVSKGAHIGFINEDFLDKEIWLLPEETYKLIKQQARAQDRPFHTSKTQLWRQLVDRGHALPGEKDPKSRNGYRATTRHKINGVDHSVIAFKESFITGSDDE